MKKHFLFLIVVLFFNSCSFNKREIVIIKTLDQYESKEENVQLGKDLIYYNYALNDITKEIPEITNEVLNNIKYEYFEPVSGEVSFRLVLINNAIKHKEILKDYFTKIVDEQIEFQLSNKSKFDIVIDSTNKYLDYFNDYELEGFWNSTLEPFRSATSKEEFHNWLTEKRTNNVYIHENRVLLSKNYYETLPGVDMKGIFSVSYTYSQGNKYIENFSCVFVNDTLKVLGYQYRDPNENAN